MTKQEFATFAMALKTYYPKEQLLPNPQAMELWYREVKDIPLLIAELALRKWVATSKWSPTIAELRSKITNIHWEAYEVITSENRKRLMPEEDFKRYKWIYETTRDYRYEKTAEPTVASLMGGGHAPRLGNETLHIGAGGKE